MAKVKVLYIRDVAGGGVVEEVAALAATARRRCPDQRVSDADIARQLIRAALDAQIPRRLHMNGRGARHAE